MCYWESQTDRMWPEGPSLPLTEVYVRRLVTSYFFFFLSFSFFLAIFLLSFPLYIFSFSLFLFFLPYWHFFGESLWKKMKERKIANNCRFLVSFILFLSYCRLLSAIFFFFSLFYFFFPSFVSSLPVISYDFSCAFILCPFFLLSFIYFHLHFFLLSFLFSF